MLPVSVPSLNRTTSQTTHTLVLSNTYVLPHTDEPLQCRVASFSYTLVRQRASKPNTWAIRENDVRVARRFSYTCVERQMLYACVACHVSGFFIKQIPERKNLRLWNVVIATARRGRLTACCGKLLRLTSAGRLRTSVTNVLTAFVLAIILKRFGGGCALERPESDGMTCTRRRIRTAYIENACEACALHVLHVSEFVAYTIN